jgi:hypothetical protein
VVNPDSTASAPVPTASASNQGQFDEVPSVQGNQSSMMPGGQAPDSQDAFKQSFFGTTQATLEALAQQIQEMKDRLPTEPMDLDGKIEELQRSSNDAMEQIKLKREEQQNQHILALEDVKLRQAQFNLEVTKENAAAQAERTELSTVRLRDSEHAQVAMTQANATIEANRLNNQVALEKISIELQALQSTQTQHSQQHQEKLAQITNKANSRNAQYIETVMKSETEAQKIQLRHEENLNQNNNSLTATTAQLQSTSEERAREHKETMAAITKSEKDLENRHIQSMENLKLQNEIALKREDRLLQDAREERILRERIALQQADAQRQASQMKMMNSEPANAKHFLMQIKHLLAEEKKVKPPAAKKIKS